jgi:hypothetical protein
MHVSCTRYVCYDCQGYNKHQRGGRDFEERVTEWATLSDAIRHMRDNPDHWVELELDVDELKKHL